MKRSREPDEDPVSGSHSLGTAEAGGPAAKLVDLDHDASVHEPASRMMCSMPPHKEVLSFRSYAEYETHYNQAHLNRCRDCGRNLPSSHLLNVHIEECHDSFVAVRRERGEKTVRSSPPSLPFLPVSLRSRVN